MDTLSGFVDWLTQSGVVQSAGAKKRKKKKKKGGGGGSSPPPPGTLRVRRSIFSLSNTQMQGLTSALDTVKGNGTYDSFVRRHFEAMTAAHRNPFFLPWHRKFLEEIEAELLAVDSSIGALPYWPWEQNSGQGSLWNAGSFGPDGDPDADDRVLEGPFQNWTALIYNVATDQLEPRATVGLVRRLGRGSTGNLPTAGDVASLNGNSVYDVSPWNTTVNSFRNRCEGFGGSGMHNRVHSWVGGDMQVGTSPNDPIFFLHHANIDRIWWNWQQTHGIDNYDGPGGPYDSMPHLQGNTTPADVFDIHERGYTYG